MDFVNKLVYICYNFSFLLIAINKYNLSYCRSLFPVSVVCHAKLTLAIAIAGQRRMRRNVRAFTLLLTRLRRCCRRPFLLESQSWLRSCSLAFREAGGIASWKNRRRRGASCAGSRRRRGGLGARKAQHVALVGDAGKAGELGVVGFVNEMGMGLLCI